MSAAPALVLGSTSRHRAALLQRLGLPFSRVAPQVDEAALADETPAACAQRLARAKALEVASRHPGCVVIGSDQVADCAGRMLGKPGSVEAACRQLREFSARAVHFHTALCVVGPQGGVGEALDATRVVFRQLDAAGIERYVAHDQPLDCAGSFRCEGLGIALFERIDSQDPTALIGLPLIALCALLRPLGYRLP